MANPQLEDGHSAISNELLEAIIRTHFSPTESAVFWTVVRKTYGWHKKIDRISFTQFEETTRMDRRHVSPALKSLIQRNIVLRQGKGYNLEYGVQKNYENWKSLPKTVTKQIVTKISNEIVTKNSNKSLPKTVTKQKGQSLPISVNIVTKNSNEIITDIGTHKNNNSITKTNIYIPEWINKETWDAFLEIRKNKKVVPTDKAMELLIKKLDDLRKAGDDPNEVLNQSIMSNWTGVFPLKKNGNKPKQFDQPSQKYSYD
jgi:phage replication O-like protein O